MSSVREAILDRAGIKTASEFRNLFNRNEQLFVTDGGNLLCKKILFVNFSALGNDSMKTVLVRYIRYSIKHLNIECKNIAFLFGEGGFNIDEFNVMILNEIKQFLDKKQLKLKILFFFPSDRNDLLKTLHSFQTEKDGFAKLHYSKTTFQILLVSSNQENLLQCQKSIKDLTKQITTIKEGNINLWDQYTINAYYKFCIDYFVLPKFDFDRQLIQLTGTVDAINNAELIFDLEIERITRVPTSSSQTKLELTKEQKHAHQVLLEKQIELDSEENSKKKIKAEKALRDALQEYGKDIGDRVLVLQRWINKYPRVTIKNILPLSPTGDINDAPFILPTDIAADPTKHLRPWLDEWIPMDFSNTPMQIYRDYEFSNLFSHAECTDYYAQVCAAERTNFLITSTDKDESVWSIVTEYIDEGGLRSKKELQRRAAFEDPTKMAKQRKKLDKYFTTEARLTITKEELAPYQHFAFRMATNTTEFNRFCREFKKTVK